MGDFQSFQISSLKRFGMEEGPMYYVIRGCRSTIIDRHGMKHPWSDPARNTGTDPMWRAARLNSKHSAAVVLMQTKQSMAVYNLWQMGGGLLGIQLYHTLQLLTTTDTGWWSCLKSNPRSIVTRPSFRFFWRDKSSCCLAMYGMEIGKQGVRDLTKKNLAPPSY